MTKAELAALKPGTKVRLINDYAIVGTFRSLNWAGLACVDGDSPFWDGARMWEEIEVAEAANYLARPRPRLGAGTVGYARRRR